MKFIHLADIPQTLAHDSLVRQRFIAPGDLKSAVQTVNFVELAEGESFEPHAHPDCEECFFALKGKAEAVIGGKQITLEKGDFLAVEAGEQHVFTNREKEPFQYFQFRVLIK